MKNYTVSEYDAFGPWIYIIKKSHPLPPLFSDYAEQVDQSIMSFKIPRNIERRRANPDMHLYDRVVCMFETHILVIDRDGDELSDQTIKYSDIKAIKRFKELLLGELTIYTDQKIITIGYNTVSDDIIAKTIDLILALSNTKTMDIGLPILDFDHNSISYLFCNLISKMQREDEDVHLVAYQPDRELTEIKSFWEKLISKFFNRQKLCDIAFVNNNRQLIVISRSSILKSTDETEYAYSYTYMPYQHLEKVQVSHHENKADIKLLSYGTKNHMFELPFDQHNIGLDVLIDKLKGLN